MSFQSLYKVRENTLAEVLPGEPRVIFQPGADHYDSEAVVRWKDDSVLVMEFRPDEVTFRHLDARGAGIYERLWEVLPGYFRALGVERFVAFPESTEAARALLDKGRFAIKGEHLEADIRVVDPEPPIRQEEPRDEHVRLNNALREL